MPDTSEPFPIRPTKFNHSIVRGGAPKLFGYDEFRGPDFAKDDRIYTYNDGNIITVDGTSGPWIARQKFGYYAGIIVRYWNNNRVRDDARMLADEFGYEAQDGQKSPKRSDITDDNVVEYLFEHVNKRDEPLPEGYIRDQL